MAVQICPNKSSKAWKEIVDKYGEDLAYAAYIKNGEDIPSLSYVDNMINEVKSTKLQEKNNQQAKSIRSAIVDQLNRMGIGIGVLEDFEEKNGINGVFDPKATKKTAEGLIELIRIAQGHRGQQALPEEFAHLVGSAMESINDPIFQRLTNIVSDPDIAKQILEDDEEGSYDKYYSAYEGNKDLIAKEARDKLITKYILKGENIEASRYQTLSQRAKDKFNKTFSKGRAYELSNKIEQAEKDAGDFVTRLMGNEIPITLNLDSLSNKNIMFNLTEHTKSLRSILTKAIETKHKQVKIQRSSGKLSEEGKEDVKKQNVFIERLEILNNDERFEDGVINFIQQATEDLSSLMEKATALKLSSNPNDMEFNTIGKFLKSIKSYVDAYSPILDDMVSYTLSNEYNSREDFNIEEPLKELRSLLDKASASYKNAASPVFKQFIKQYAQDAMGQKVGGRIVDEQYIEDLVDFTTKDIGFFDRWLFSASESNDTMLRLLERPIKHYRFLAMQSTNEIAPRVLKARDELEKAGFKSDFIYEKDKDGNPTGYFIRELKWDEYYKDLNTFKKELDKKYHDRAYSNLWYKEYAQWKKDHTDIDEFGNELPKSSLYTNPEFSKLSPAQLKFYNFILNVKKEADDKLPDHMVDNMLAPQTRKDYLEILKESTGIKDTLKKVKSHLGDRWLERETDDEFGNSLGITGFDSRKIESLPIYYTRKLHRLETYTEEGVTKTRSIPDMGNLSTDIVSSMIMYADMANNYDALNKIVDIMELGRNVMRLRSISDTKNGKPLVEKFQNAGRTIENKIIKPTESTRFMERVNDLFSMQLYGQYQKEQGSIDILGNHISIAKLAGNINGLTALSTYATNLNAAVSNVTTGTTMIHIEAAAKEFFDGKSLLKADKKFGSYLAGVVGDLGKAWPTSKLGLMVKTFNLLQDNDKAIKEIEANKKNLTSRLIMKSPLFFLTNCGEFYMQTKTFLAMCDRIKLKDSSGNLVDLDDALEVKNNEFGVPTLSVKQDYTKEDGSNFTLKDIEAISRKCARINQKLHGVYNKEDMNALKSLAQGRLLMMFRSYMPTAYNRRFQKENYSFDLGSVEEGFYRTTWNFMKGLAQDIKQHQFDITTKWNTLAPHQKANLKRAMAEVGMFIGTMIFLGIAKGLWDDDDKTWARSFTVYQLSRLETEIGAMIPFNPQFLNQILTLVQSPAAAVNTGQNLLNLLRVWDLTSTVKSGPYKDMNKYLRDILRVIPLQNQIRRSLNPDEALKFYLMSVY